MSSRQSPSLPSSEAIERVARQFHQVYEQLAPSLGYRTRIDSAVPWEEVPERNRTLMIQTVLALTIEGWITIPERES